MRASILICDSDAKWAKELKAYFESKQYEVTVVIDGKSCQDAIYKNKFGAVILQHSEEKHSSLNVLKYIKFNSPSTRIIYTVGSLADLKNLGIEEGSLKNLGCYDVLEKPIDLEKLLELVEMYNNPKLWNHVEKTGESKNAENVNESDEHFERVLASSFYSGNTTIFDIFVRLGKDRYIKVLHKGDAFDRSRLNKYIEDKNVEHFYFKKSDRLIYINYMNSLISKLVKNDKVASNVKSNMTQSVSEKFISEIYTEGLNHRVVEEGKKLCDNIYGFLDSQKNLKKIIDHFCSEVNQGIDHSFLVSFFSLVIAKNVSWVTERSINILGMGALLHDIGKVNFPPELRGKKFHELTDPKEIEIYKRHPSDGRKILEGYPFLNPGILEIVAQHHEKIDGTGYPAQLNSMKTYPLAKVVSLANRFVNEVTYSGEDPTTTLQKFVKDQRNLAKYDNSLIRSLMKSFTAQEAFKKAS